MKKKHEVFIPDLSSIEAERKRLRHQSRYRRSLMGTIGVLIVVAAVAVLIAMLFMPVFHVTGTSMQPSLNEGDIVIGLKSEKFECGQVCGLYYNNKLLLKRAIATAGSWVDIDEDGNVAVDGVPVDEPYVMEKSYGICDIEFPYQVPDGSVFVLGDNRATSLDSRSSVIGSIPADEIVGKILFRVWPLSSIGPVK